jgi:hypothetical protein
VDPVEDALAFFERVGPAARALAAAAPAEREAMEEGLRNMLADHRRDDKVAFRAAAWIWSATAGEAA